MNRTDFLLQTNWARTGLASVLRWTCVFALAVFLLGCVANEEPLESADPIGSTGGTGGDGDPGGTGGDGDSDGTDDDGDMGGSGGGDTGGDGTGDPPPMSDPPPNDQAIFEATLYPLLTDPNNFCANCHDANQAPTFAAADLGVAYNALVGQQKVNLQTPQNSRVYLRPKDDRHNCGGEASCDRIAMDFLAAIQDWAAQAGTSATPPDDDGPVTSAATTFAAAMDGGVARADANLIALFEFAEGSGDVTMDTSGVGAPIALQIEGMEWVEGGGLRNVSGKAQANAADSEKIFDLVTQTGAFTAEAWVIPDNTAQDGPARIVSFSQDTGARNFTMGQNGIYYVLRNRSESTGANGTPALEALDPQVDTVLQHVAMTFDPLNGRKIYINGQLAIEENVADTLTWVSDQTFVLGNEVTNDRLWQGVFRLVALHNQALSAAEVQQNFDAGAGNTVTLRFDVANVVGGTAYIDMQASQLDAGAYMFAKPVFVSDSGGIAVKNIRIAVNGAIPIAAQVFRRIDTMVMESGTELSPLGAVIPVDQGIDDDQIQLVFEVLGARMGDPEQVPPPAPPPAPADVAEPDSGLRTFSQINDTMAVLTGVDPNGPAIRDRYSELRDSLPGTALLDSFSAAQQIAIQRLATTYCGEIVADGASCDAFFGTCDIAGNGKTDVADVLYDAFVGDNLAIQPDRADISSEVVSLIDDLGCANGCNGAEAQTVLQASCAAVLSSGAVIIN